MITVIIAIFIVSFGHLYSMEEHTPTKKLTSIEKELLWLGTNISNGNETEKPLKRAIRTGDYDIVKLLLGDTQLVNEPLMVEWHNTTFAYLQPLAYACMKQQWDIATLLVERGASVNCITGIAENTPLHDAVLAQDIKLVELLLQHGADVNKKNKAGKTPFAYKDSAGDDNSIAKLLIQYGASIFG